MANIKLTGIAKQFEDKTPTTAVNLTNFTEKLKTKYSDLHLDLLDVQSSGLYKDNPISSGININDIQKDINEQAITNSVKNWLRTSKYSRLLNPEIDLNLRSYLFESLDTYTAYFIGMEIMKFLPYFEPRITIEQCEITIDYNNSAFIVSLQLNIPELSKTISVTEVLGEQNNTTY